MNVPFDKVTRAQRISLVCKVCGQPFKRDVIEVSTVNPWNRNPDGSVRTLEEVGQYVDALLTASLDRVKKKGSVCRRCSAMPHGQPTNTILSMLTEAQ